MHRVTLLCVLLCATVAVAQDPTALSDGTKLIFRTVKPISSSAAIEGERVPLALEEEVRVGNVLAGAKGARGWAKVASIRRSPTGHIILELQLEQLELASGLLLPLRADATGNERSLTFQSAQPDTPAEVAANTEIIAYSHGKRAIETGPSAPPPVAKTVISPSPPPVPVAAAVIQDGTPVRLRLGRTVSSADTQVDERVDFEVLDEVKVGDLVVIEKGATAFATITEAQRKRRMGRAGKLNMNIDHVRLSNGEKAPLRAVKEARGGGKTGAMTGAIVATAIVFWPAAPLFLFMSGKDIVIPKGTEITAYVNGDIEIKRPQVVGPTPTMAMAPARAAAEVQITITSTPPGADIEVDGAFVGNSPSVVGVTPGEHTIRITKSGYLEWTRKIRVSSGNVNISAELQATAAESSTQK